MQKITVSQLKRALAAREKLAAGRVAGQSEGMRVDATVFRQAAQSRYEAAKYLGGGVFRSVVMVNKPLFWGTVPAGIWVDESIEPGNSWVKINVDDPGLNTHGRLDKLFFYYVWENATAYTSIVDVSAYMTVSGSWEAKADIYSVHVQDDPNDPNYDPGDHTSAGGSAHLEVSAEMALYEWWNQPPTLAPLQNAPDQQTRISLLNLDLQAQPPDPVFRSGFLFNWFALKQNLLVIPPEGMLVAELSFDVDHKVHAGRVLADFASGEGNQVTSHWLQVEYVSGPPITLTPVAGQGLMHP